MIEAAKLETLQVVRKEFDQDELQKIVKSNVESQRQVMDCLEYVNKTKEENKATKKDIYTQFKAVQAEILQVYTSLDAAFAKTFRERSDMKT